MALQRVVALMQGLSLNFSLYRLKPLQIGLLLVPLRVDPPSLVKRFLRFSLVAGKKLWQWLGWHPV